MGRCKIEIKMIRDKAARQVTFSKRRAGLFKKANELAIMCGVEIAIIVFSPGNKPYSFGNPSVESVTGRFLGENSGEKSSGSCSAEKSSGSCGGESSPRRHRKINKLNQQYGNLKVQLQIEEKKGEMLEKTLKENNLKKSKLPIDELDLSELEKLKGKLEELQDFLKLQVSEIEASSSLLLLAQQPINGEKNCS